MSALPPPILARGLKRAFGDVVAVAGVDLEARAGSCLALLGPNGAGKTTTIEMLEGLGRPDAGEVKILGFDWRTGSQEIRERIGVQLQETKFFDKLTARETLSLFQSFYGRTRTLDEVLDLVGLGEKQHARVVHLSGGQKQRLALGCALINHPDVLFLDEPTTGLDPQARRRVWEIVDAFKSDGGTVLLTTHYMDEAERLADDVAIMDLGEIISEGSPDAIIQSLGAESIVEFKCASSSDTDVAALGDLTGVRSAQEGQGVITLTVDDTQEALRALFEHAPAAGLGIDDLRTHRPTLEDVFVTLTGKQLRDE